MCDAIVVEKYSVEFSVETNYGDVPYCWLKGMAVIFLTVSRCCIIVSIWLDGEKLKRSQSVEMLEDGPLYILKLHNCQLSDTSEIKFVSKTAESKAKLTVKGMPNLLLCRSHFVG